MPIYHYEITKVIVVSVEADNECDASINVVEMLADGEYLDSFYKSEPQLKLLDVEEA